MCFTVPRRIIRSQHSASCCNAYASTHHTLLLRQSERNKLWTARWGANRPYLDSSRATARWRRVGHPPLWFAPRLSPRPSPSPLPASLVTSSSVWTVELASWAGPGRAQSPHCFCLGQRVAFFFVFFLLNRASPFIKTKTTYK